MTDNAHATGSERPNCQRCRHFFITHQPSHPYGCRAMNFKSAQMPAVVVRINSGLECQLFERKER